MKKKIIIVLFVVILVIITAIIFSNRNYKLSTEKGEEVAYASLRVAISQSVVDGSGEMTSEDFDILGEIVKNQKSSNQWFGGHKAFFTGKIIDTSDYEITVITDGTYVARFTIENDGNDYKLIDYKFEIAIIENGATFFVKE